MDSVELKEIMAIRQTGGHDYSYTGRRRCCYCLSQFHDIVFEGSSFKPIMKI